MPWRRRNRPGREGSLAGGVVKGEAQHAHEEVDGIACLRTQVEHTTKPDAPEACARAEVVAMGEP